MDTQNETRLLSLLNHQYENIENGLLYGKAGLALYYARLSSSDKAYNATYNKLINDILAITSNNTPIDFSRGLLGIGVAIDLILKYYKKGTSDYVLEDIDATIYKNLDINNQKIQIDMNLVSEGLFYIALHLKYGIKNKTKRNLFIRKAKSLIEYIYSEQQFDLFKETIPGQLLTKDFFFLYSLTLLYEQEIYKDRLCHICDELIYKLFSATPILQFNKLKRVFLVSKILSTVSDLSSSWEEYQKSLVSQISIHQLIYVDLKDRQLHLNDGLTGVFLMMEKVNEYSGSQLLSIPWDYYYSKVKLSSMKEDLSKENLPIYDLGLNGFWGINYYSETRSKSKI